MPSVLFSIGTGALTAARMGLQTASHNIANANTAGYSRQSTLQGTNTPQFTGAGFMGQGVHVSTVRREYSGFLEAQVQSGTARMGELGAWRDQAGRIDNLLADPTAGLTPAMTEFFSGLQALAAHPADTAARQSLLSSAQALSGRFASLDGRLNQLKSETNGRISSEVDSINGYTKQIAELNDRIRLATASDTQPPNDLLDQRDNLIRTLNGSIQATAVAQSDGSVNVFFGNGQPAVVGNEAYQLVAKADAADPSQLAVSLQTPGGLVGFRTSDVGGGTLAGLISFRDVTLPEAVNSLGRIAMTMAQSFNDQHRAGMDLTGALGGDFFGVAVPNVVPNAGNTGGAALSAAVSNYASLGNSDYRVSYDGTNYLVTRLSDGNAQSFAALPQTVDGVDISVTGTPAAGDSFLVQPTHDGARDFAVLISDASRIAAASPVRSASSRSNIGNATISAPVVAAPPNANLTQPVTITFTSTGTFDVSGTGTGNPTGLVYTPGGSLTYNGWTVQLSGSPQAGDTFTVSLNTGGSGDNRNALALGQLQTAKVMAGGTASLGDSYAALVGSIGGKTHELDVSLDAQTALMDQAVAAREGLSGVNLDEEAANLLRYQQAYQAAGKVIQIADEAFAAILNLGS